MALYDTNQPDEKKRECFLCTLDPKHTCSEVQLDGRLVAAQERLLDGEKTAVIILDTGTQRVEVRLDGYYYRSLVKELKARGDVLGLHNLRLRVYHLPLAPLSVTYKERSRLCYKANSYTLAVLEPDLLLNITDLNQAEYCARQYILNRLIPSTTSAATIRGNLVHHCFKELLKEHDRGKFVVHSNEESETPLSALHRHLDQALQLHSIDMALAAVSSDAMRGDVAPHLESLAAWYERERNTLWDMPASYADAQSEDDAQQSHNQVRAETFLLAPEIGLRGRLDLFWQQSGRQRLLELKTGGASGTLPRREHRWQVYGYHALLTVRRDSQMKRALATLLYSGTPGSAQAFGIPATIREIQRVNETRNILVLSRVTSIPPAPPGPSRCTKCSMLEHCQHISSLLQWQPPEPDPEGATPRYMPTSRASIPATPARPTNLSWLPLVQEDADPPDDSVPVPLVAPQERPQPAQRSYPAGPQDREFFARYYQLLHMEGRAGEQQQALLWNLSVSERIERGTAIHGLELLGKPVVDKDGWTLVFRCTNTSELRDGDEILLSSGNPISGEVVSGTIMSISSEAVTVWTRELIAHPVLIDRYDNDLVHVRTLQNLLRWQHATPHQRDLVAGRVRPRFLGENVPPRSDFNSEQNLAIARALQMQDYLLIHGPPGTGKTSVIAEIIIRLAQQKQRVMLAGFTNQAVDNMLKRLDKEGFHNYLRLGQERSVAETVRPRLLKELIAIASQVPAITGEPHEHLSQLPQANSFEDIVHDILHTTPVVASTTATWSSDKYSAQSAQGDADLLESSGLYFDVAIIDEAGQLTVPAILGALRFAKRFILVGDEKQLPPLVLSKEAAEAGLAHSLFSYLKQLDENYMQEHPLAISACVPLRVQYRMNKWIANFASTVFYDRLLVAHASVANRRMVYPEQKLLPADEAALLSHVLEPRFPLVFLDVRDSQASAEAKQNHAEAGTVRDLVAGLLARGIAPQDIGIIAPYRAQVANIRRHLFSTDLAAGWTALPADTPIGVDTVDRFQGGERQVIIMSFATAQEPAIASQRRDFLVNPNRLNVALTRAQRKLILVGSVLALEHLPTFNRLITYCRSMNTLLTLQQPTSTDAVLAPVHKEIF